MTGDLLGRTVAVLRTGGAPDAVADALRARGAKALTVVVGTVEDRPDASVAAGVGELGRFAWVVVTSANAARRLAPWATSWPASTRIGAVGPATRAAVEALGLRCDATAPGGTARDLASSLDAGPVLFLAAATARRDLDEELTARGIDVVTVEAYDVRPRALPSSDVEVLASCDVVVAMSPLAIDALVAAVGSASPPLLVAIGPTTADRAAARALRVAGVAASREPGAVAEAVRAAFEG